METLSSRIINQTKRAYPDGYGFAIDFLKHADRAIPDLRDAACACAALAFKPRRRTLRTPWRPVPLHYPFHSADVARFVSAWQPSAGRAEWWLIEAAQLVIQFALHPDTPPRLRAQCELALAKAGHVGYDMPAEQTA